MLLKIKFNVSGFLLTSVFNSKTTEVEDKITDIKSLANKAEIANVENKIPDISNLVTKPDYATEIIKIKNEYATAAALDAKDLVQKTYFDAELKKVDDKVGKNSSDILLYENRFKQKEDTLHDLERDASYFRGKNDDGMQNYFVVEPVCKYFKMVIKGSAVYAYYWQSRGLSNGSSSHTSNTDFTLENCLLGAVKVTKNSDID